MYDSAVGLTWNARWKFPKSLGFGKVFVKEKQNVDSGWTDCLSVIFKLISLDQFRRDAKSRGSLLVRGMSLAVHR